MSDAASGARAAFRDRVRARAGRAELLLFRVGHERFGLELGAVEEAVDLAGLSVHGVPGNGPAMLGVLSMRGALVPLYSAAVPLRVSGSRHDTALVFRRGEARVALAVDDAEDVLVIDLAAVRPAPHAERDAVLLGVLQQGPELIGLVDGAALLAACGADPSLEIS